MGRAAGFDEEDLRARLIELSPDAMVELVFQAIDRLPGHHRGLAGTNLPADELATLEEGMGDLPEIAEKDRGFDPVAEIAADLAAVVSTSLDVERAAALLQVDPSRIRQRIRARSLYAFSWHRRWLLPDFQFVEDGVLPGFAEVVRHLDPDLSPAEVTRWLRTPDPDLTPPGSDTPVSPFEWLAAARPAARIVPLAEGLSELP